MKRSFKPIYIVLSITLVLAIAAVVLEISLSSSSSTNTLGANVSMEPSEPAPTEPDARPSETAAPVETKAPTETTAETTAPSETEAETAAPTETEAPAGTADWRLVLVNADHPLNPDDLPEKFTTLRNGVQIDERIYDDLQQMFDDAREQGIYPIVGEGFRTGERQQEIMDKYIATYQEQGYDEETAKQMALSIVAVPGTSEHELGLALDINADEESTSEEVYIWLAANAYKYGFILRYPAQKEEITGISYEPWHYRYVGKEAAEEIFRSGECLEEYLQRIA